VIVLGFDTATSATAVALRTADGRIAQARDDPPRGDHPGHATRLLAMSGELLLAAGVAWGEIERIAVGVGPGTFTGLRVGIATARGLAQSLEADLVGVSSLRALASAAFAVEGAEQADVWGSDGQRPDGVLAVIDARRGEAFLAAYGRSEGEAPDELTPPRPLAPEELAGVVSEAEHAAGGAARRWLAIGDGAVRYRAHLQSDAVWIAPDSSPLHRVSGGAVCELGALEKAGSYEQVVPDYRRRPDAELALEGAGAGRGAQS
jgi:tRNA threonylcarbamoyladenosine biosynthesis protein TsaB